MAEVTGEIELEMKAGQLTAANLYNAALGEWIQQVSLTQLSLNQDAGNMAHRKLSF